jgi:hypothetical protein
VILVVNKYIKYRQCKIFTQLLYWRFTVNVLELFIYLIYNRFWAVFWYFIHTFVSDVIHNMEVLVTTTNDHSRNEGSHCSNGHHLARRYSGCSITSPCRSSLLNGWLSSIGPKMMSRCPSLPLAQQGRTDNGSRPSLLCRQLGLASWRHLRPVATKPSVQ